MSAPTIWRAAQCAVIPVIYAVITRPEPEIAWVDLGAFRMQGENAAMDPKVALADVMAVPENRVRMPLALLRLGIWYGARDHWQAVRECWNAGVRGAGLAAPEDWWAATVH